MRPAGDAPAHPRGDAPRRRRAVGRRLVVVGTGMAGLRVVEEVLARDPAWRVTMLGEEPGPAYNRILLSKLLAGECGPGELGLRPAAWYAQHGIDLRGGCPATAVDTAARTVTDARGEVHAYDALVLATGSRPFVPPIEGAGHAHVFRTTADVGALASAARSARRAVVLGGGLLGLEAAAGLRARGLAVHVVEAAPRLMGRQLDRDASELLARALAARGISTTTGRAATRITQDAVLLDDGTRLEAQIAVIAAGVRPETRLASEAGLPVARGIVVDDALRAGAPGVFAVGECAEHRGIVYGLWAPLAEQAAAAGAVIAGDPGAFHGAVTATTLKVAGLDVYAGGRPEAAADEDEVLVRDSRRGVLRKLVLDGDRLVGAILVGDVADARRCSAALRTGAPVDDALLAAGLGGAAGDREPDPSELICSCNAVTAGAIAQAIAGAGARTVAQVAAATRASTGCGGCAPEIKALLARSSTRNREDADGKPRAASIAP